MSAILDYRFGPKEKSGDIGHLGRPMLSVRQALMMPAMPVLCLSVLAAAPLLTGADGKAWRYPFIVTSAFFGAIACAIVDAAGGLNPRWDFRDQCWLLGLRLK